MRLIRFVGVDSQVHVGKDLGGDKVDLLSADPFLAFPAKPQPTGEVVDVVERLCPVWPASIFCIGMNYRSHVAEMGGQVPERPVVFMKPTSSLQHPGQPVVLPKVQQPGGEVDQEAELAVVIGQSCKDVAVEDALDYVLGYTCANDVSARCWQKQGGGGQWIRGKGFDTFCPLGPVLVTHGDDEDEISDPQTLAIRGYLGDTLMQDGHTSDMIFNVAELIAFLSQDTTLLPGTVILTGTPPGVGWAREPKLLMKAGMQSVIEIDKIGALENAIESAS